MTLSPPPSLSSLFIEGMPARSVKALQTTVERAQTLRSDGYRFVRRAGTSIWDCYKPAKLNKKTGELTEFEPYVVEIQGDSGSCSCEGFYHNGYCKHERACRSALCEALELLLGAGEASI